MPLLELSPDLLVELGGWAAMKEARSLVECGKVTEARHEGANIHARVQSGEKIYEPRITLAERVSAVEVQCTCVESRKSGRVCAHVLAAGWAPPSSCNGKNCRGFPPDSCRPLGPEVLKTLADRRVSLGHSRA